MSTRFSTALVLAAFGLALVGGPAFAATAKKPAAHNTGRPAASAASSADTSADSLNAQSLSAAQSGRSFTPSK